MLEYLFLLTGNVGDEDVTTEISGKCSPSST